MNTRCESLHRRFEDKGASSVPSCIRLVICRCNAMCNSQRQRIVHIREVLMKSKKNRFTTGTRTALEVFASHGHVTSGATTVDESIALHENGLGNLLGRSHAMRQVFQLIQRVAPTEATVMIMGESGTGKEVVAECIHLLSQRVRGPMVAINCGSIPA